MNKALLVPILAVVIAAGGVIGYAVIHSNNSQQTHSAAMERKAEHETVMKKDIKKEASATSEAMTKGIYTGYAAAKLANAEKGNVVLFFHAPWCPTCKEADKNFTSASTPEGLTLLKTDYDSSTELKKKYGVTYQHTFVQVDKDGNLIKKWSGSTNYGAIEKELNT